MSRDEKTSKMLALVDQYRGSGLTQDQFCREQGIAISVLRYWLAKLRQEINGPGFIQLDGIIQQEFRIVYPNGIELFVPTQTPITHIQQLIQF